MTAGKKVKLAIQCSKLKCQITVTHFSKVEDCCKREGILLTQLNRRGVGGLLG